MSFFVIIRKRSEELKMTVETLRKKYQEFHYYGMDIEENETELVVVYHFEIIGLAQFNPSCHFPKQSSIQFSNKRMIKNLLFSLGMVELISYWKATCSPKVIIHESTLDNQQILWWKKLYFNGLGEFFYLNRITLTEEEMMDIHSLGQAYDGEELQQSYSGNLIPVGGGKDSFVSLEILKEMKPENKAFVINHVISAVEAAKVAGYAENLLHVERKLDSKIIELNKQGFLNGHTPFSAMVAFSSVITAILWGKRYVCLSNEASANESTVKDASVNHQYSKSYEFEQDFNGYLEKYIGNPVHYFSLLRGLSELQIVSIFATLKDYHPVFKSCNVGSKKGEWCCDCAKCLFVAVMLSAFLTDEEISNIFHEAILEKESMWDLLKELSGISDNKPFECVGTREEVQVAISIAIQKRTSLQKELPLLYKKYQAWVGSEMHFDVHQYREEYNEENFIPQEYQALVKKKVKECWN